MSSLLYQTFYPYNKFDDGKTIHKLEKWMLSKASIEKNLFGFTVPNRGFSGETTEEFRRMNGITPIVSQPIIHPELKIPKSQFIVPFTVPDKMDTLFWCLYISHYGEAEYLAIGNKYGNAKIAEKQKIMETLKSNKNALKNLNRKITLGAAQEIMSDLMTNMKTSLLSLVAFSVYYKKNILLLNTINKTFLEYRYDDKSIANISEPGELRELGSWLIIKYTDKKKYGFYPEDISDISHIISEYIYIQSPDKPLKGISTYKIGELVEIASKISMAKESKMSKPDLYGKIWHSLLWA